MTVREALVRMSHQLVVCSDHHAEAARTVLRLGAGAMWPEGAVPAAPSGLVPERREIWLACAEAIQPDGTSGDTSWEPIHAGDWEDVLATLIIEGRWETIERTAADLRRDLEARRG